MNGDDAVQQLFPDRQWLDLWTPETLARFAPKRGLRGDPRPVLEVHLLEKDGSHGMGLIVLDIEGFNEWSVRRQVLHDLGVTWATDGWQILALVFAACAWTRAFTDAERAARAGRLVEDYEDKQEVVMAQGKTLDGRKAYAQSEILRDTTGRVRATRAWHIAHAGEAVQMDFSTLDVAWSAYLRTLVALRGQGPELHG